MQQPFSYLKPPVFDATNFLYHVAFILNKLHSIEAKNDTRLLRDLIEIFNE